MYKSFARYIVLFCLLLFCSCNKKFFTHQQAMQSFHTKDDVLQHLGNPDQVKEGTDVEEWIYTRNIMYIQRRSQKQDTVHAVTPHSDTLKVKRIDPNIVYTSFLFDREGNVTGYRSQNVNLGHIYKEPFGITALKVLGIAALIVIAVSVNGNSSSDFDF